MFVILAIIALFPGYYGLTHHIVLLTYGALALAVVFLLAETVVAVGRHRR